MPDEYTQQRIDATRSEVSKSDLPPETKDALQTRLDHAARCSDPKSDRVEALCQAQADSIIQEVRAAIRLPLAVRAEVAAQIGAHVAACQSGGAGRGAMPKNVREFLFAVAAQYPLLVGIAALWVLKTLGADGIKALAVRLLGM